jgi:hypothetical protein
MDRAERKIARRDVAVVQCMTYVAQWLCPEPLTPHLGGVMTRVTICSIVALFATLGCGSSTKKPTHIPSVDSGSTGGSSGTGGIFGTTGGSSGTGGSFTTGGSGGSPLGSPDGSADSGSPSDAPVADAEPADAATPDAPPKVYEAVKAPWLGKDIGTVAAPGGVLPTTTTNGGQNFELNGGGMTGIGGMADSGFFMYQPAAGPATLQGRLVSLTMSDPNSVGGLMIRDSLDPDAAMIFVGAVGDGTGGKVIVRHAKGEAAVTAPVDGTTLPGLKVANNTVVRLVRFGGVVRIFAGSVANIDSDSSLVGGGMAEIQVSGPNSTLLYGMVVSAGGAGAAQAKFNETGLANLASNNATADWLHWSIGTTAASAIWTTNRLTLSALGQPWGAVAGTSRDFLGFSYVRTNNADSVRFLVASEAAGDPGSRVAAMIRDVGGAARNGATVALSLTNGTGLQLQQRQSSSDGSDLTTVASKDGLKAPLWLRLDRSLVARAGDPLGTSDTWISAYYAEDNNGAPRAWQLVGTSLSFPTTTANPPGLGIGVASYDPTAFHQAEVRNVSVVTAPAPGLIPVDAGADAATPEDASAASDGSSQ